MVALGPRGRPLKPADALASVDLADGRPRPTRPGTVEALPAHPGEPRLREVAPGPRLHQVASGPRGRAPLKLCLLSSSMLKVSSWGPGWTAPVPRSRSTDCPTNSSPFWRVEPDVPPRELRGATGRGPALQPWELQPHAVLRPFRLRALALLGSPTLHKGAGEDCAHCAQKTHFRAEMGRSAALEPA